MMNQISHNAHNDWLNQTPLDDGIWLSMLVDNELSPQQRARYVEHLKSTNDWQRVAVAFLDEQVLQTHVVSPDKLVSEVGVVRPVEPKPGARWTQYLGMALCLLLGLLVGPLLQSGTSSPEVVDGSGLIQPIDQDVLEPEESAINVSLPGLYQVSDTQEEAVYYADFSVPQFLLDALVLAGHRVTFDQEFLGYTETSDNAAAVPINVIRIQKYGRLLAALE